VAGCRIFVAGVGTPVGDALVRVVIETPKKLTARQRELLEEFARLGGEEVHPISKGFLDKVREMFG
jgi:molecular chaperone DnaJ